MELHSYQKKIVEYISNKESSILSVGLGLGKTISILTYIEENQPETVIIVAPKEVAKTVWKQEAEKWNLSIAGKMVIVEGNAQKRHRHLHDASKPYKIVSRDLLKDIEGWKTDLLVLDELTSFKNPFAKRFIFCKSITAKKKVGLTGTLLANGYIDVWGQAKAVGLFENQYTNFYSWRGTFFYNAMQGTGQKFEKWVLRKGVTPQQLLQPIKNNIFTLKSEDWIELPKVSIIRKSVELNKQEMVQYMKFSALLQVNIGDVNFSVKEAAKFFKLQTLVNGFVYDKEGQALRGKYHTKIKAVADFCERAVGEGEQLLLFYSFREEAMMLGELFKKSNIRFCSPADRKYMQKWKAGEIDILISHPASIAHGVNLQHESRIIVWSTITYNMELFLQGNGRIARQGQKRPVSIYTFIGNDTVEEHQLKKLEGKVKEQDSFVNNHKITAL